MQIEKLETERSHGAKTFSKLRRNHYFSSRLTSYIQRVDLVITQMTVFYTESP